MPKRLSTVQFSILLGTVLALFASGIVAGAAGSAIILGSANDAGFSNTTVKTNSSGIALQMNNVGTGVGGFMLSTSGTGLAAQTSSGSKFGGSFTNQGGSDGGGGAILATGKANYGIVALSDAKPPIKVTAAQGVAPFEVNSSTKVTNLNSDLVDGYSANGLLRFQWNATDHLLDGDGAAAGGLVAEITIPGPGYLIIWGQGSVFMEETVGSDEVTCSLRVNNLTLATSYARVDVFKDATYEQNNDTCSTNNAYLVCNAAMYSVMYYVESVSTATDINHAATMVEYVPFDGNGNGPSC
jgi:hypothetical protein